MSVGELLPSRLLIQLQLNSLLSSLLFLPGRKLNSPTPSTEKSLAGPQRLLVFASRSFELTAVASHRRSAQISVRPYWSYTVLAVCP